MSRRSRGLLLLALLAVTWLIVELRLSSPAPLTGSASPLPAAVLIERLQADRPGTRVVELRVSGVSDQPAVAWLQASDATAAPLRVLVDRSSGAQLKEAQPHWSPGAWLEQLSAQMAGRPRSVAAALVLLYVVGVYWTIRRRRLPASAVDAPRAAGEPAPILVTWASQTGTAQALAQHTQEALKAGGRSALLRPLQQISGADLVATRQVLFVVSTYGEGDPPDEADSFVRKVMRASWSLGHLRFAVLALGDRAYTQFCGFGHTLDRWLRAQGAHAIFDPVEVDAGDPAALRHWQSLLNTLGAAAQSDWSPPVYQAWQLMQREWLNPGSPGQPVFRIVLGPAPGTLLPQWQAGDIAEIGPSHGPDAVQQWMEASGIKERELVHAGSALPLSQLLARHHWPQAAELATDHWLDQLKPLPHREYSIASLPAAGHVELLIRQQIDPQGQLGLGSGWLTEFAPLHANIALRIRTNSAFHPQPSARPLILIGNGTGLAGLRAHLLARPAGTRNWLLYGERCAAHDVHYRVELDAWLASGHLDQLDLAFSRDDSPRMYVQDLLPMHATRLAEWVQDGAAIYVCGSLQGMAPAVDAALEGILGRSSLDALVDEQRYRRDVY